ncbi:unnamed protein product [Euphydryas editha]|uniref:Flexible cuticle protein 12 n=1 Tax=Euphydryas editha TaxID=104508 RepID=A0AAU9V0C3_EUPED|nr:unnamed protein product [Euphydryas editha]
MKRNFQTLIRQPAIDWRFNFSSSQIKMIRLAIRNLLFIAFALLVAAAAAIPVDSSKDAKIENYEFENIGVGPYDFGYKTSDGKEFFEHAIFKNVGTDNQALEVTGRYSFLGSDGVFYEVTYTADENGFHPQGAHLPK